MIVCQHCREENAADEPSCSRCGKKLLVISTHGKETPVVNKGHEQISLEEHLLERISLLEEALRATVNGLQRSLDALRRLEKTNLVGQAGLAAIEEVLTRRGVVAVEEVRDAWHERLHQGLLAAEKYQALSNHRDVIVADFEGEERELFGAQIDEALEALATFDTDGALDHLEQALRLDPTNPLVAALAGELHLLVGRSAQALERFDDALTRDPDQYEALVYSGILLHESGRSSAARSRLRRAVELKPSEFLGWLGLGSLCLDQKELREAVVYLERALEMDRIPTVLGLLGKAYRQAGKLGRAAAVLEEAIQLDPTADEFQYQLGRTYVARGWGNKGQEALATALSLNPVKHGYGALVDALPSDDGEVWQSQLQRAAECSDTGNYSDARRIAERIMAGSGQSRVMAKAGAVVIEALRAEGRSREGVEWAEKLLAVDDPLAQFVGNYEIAFGLAELNEELDRAVEVAGRAVALDIPQMGAEAAAALGWVHYKRGELDRALESLQQAVDSGDRAAHLKLLGIVHSARGETVLADALLDEAEVLVGRDQWAEGVLRDQLLDRHTASPQQALGLPVEEWTGEWNGHN